LKLKKKASGIAIGKEKGLLMVVEEKPFQANLETF